MAGAGYKLFNTGDVLTAQQVNEYLMQQTVMVFASAAARTTALSGVLAEGMVSYLQDTNVVEIYTGASWVSLDDPNAIQNTIIDAKGDLISATAADTPARLASSGVNGDILTVDTSTATGLKWATPTGSSANWSLLNAGGTSLSGGQTVTVSGISGKNAIMILVDQASSDAATSTISIRLNGDTGTNYYNVGSRLIFTSAYSANNLSPIDSLESGIIIGRMSNTASSVVSGYVLLNGCNTAGVKVFNCGGTGSPAASNDQYAVNFGGYYSGSSTISSVSVFSSSGNLDGGLIYIYTTA